MSEEKIVFTRPKRQTKSFAERNHDYLLLLVVVGICGACGLIGSFLIFSVTKPPVAKTEDPPLVVSSGVPADGYEDNFAFMTPTEINSMTPSTVNESAALLGIAYASLQDGKSPEMPLGCVQAVFLESAHYEMMAFAGMVDAFHLYEVWTNLRPRPLLRAQLKREDFVTAYAVLPTLSEKSLTFPIDCPHWDLSLIATDLKGVKTVTVSVKVKSR